MGLEKSFDLDINFTFILEPFDYIFVFDFKFDQIYFKSHKIK